MESNIIDLLSFYTEELRENQDSEEAKVWLKMIVRDLSALLTGERVLYDITEVVDDEE